MRSNQTLGREGEDKVSELLLAQGWKLLARNWRRPGLELDLVLSKGTDLLVIEVKTRTYAGDNWDLCQLISWQKRRALARGVQAFLGKLPSTEALTIRLYLALVFKKPQTLQVQWFPLDLPEF